MISLTIDIILQTFLLDEFKDLAEGYQKKTYDTFKEKCFSCFPFSTKQAFFCHQKEADSLIFYDGKILDQRHDIDTIVIDAEDTDVIVIAAYVRTILKKKLIWYRSNRKLNAVIFAQMK